MADEIKQNWTALWSVDGIGLVTFSRILKLHRRWQLSWSELWLEMQKKPERFHLHQNQVTSLSDFQRHFTPQSYDEYLQEKQIAVVSITEPVYPILLKEIPNPPPILFVKGSLSHLPVKSLLAIVGTRQLTAYGKWVTTKITQEVVAAGFTTVSGFMYGVDCLVHEVTHTQKGHTIGVLGFGFDEMYPKAHQSLFEELVMAGQTFITEYAPSVKPTKGTFPQRNRLVAGLSLGVLVTEAAAKSGSHITAQWAIEYGRTVYAVPGPITSPLTEGTKALINQGALCVSSGAEIVRDLAPQLLPSFGVMTELEQAILTALRHKSHNLAELTQLLPCPISELLSFTD